MSASPAPRISPLNAFEAYGIEIEYALVDNTSFAVLPIADQVLLNESSKADQEMGQEMLQWSNELVSHVVEVKNVYPTANLQRLGDVLQNEVRAMNQRLKDLGACLMPAGMHPWMDTRRETHLWTHNDSEIYQTFHRLFDCKTHGWANLQSLHVNLPFADDEEFSRLHAAIRLALPILPAIAASSPIADGAATGFMDYRKEVYRNNAKTVPSITGKVIPETVANREAYESQILAPMYVEIAPFDPDGTLQYEWLNARGAIARFDRNAIEIRLVDTQECPHADIAIAAVIIDLVKMLYDEETATLSAQQSISTDDLSSILLACIRHSDLAEINHADYLNLLAYPSAHCKAGDLWRHLVQRIQVAKTSHVGIWAEPLSIILKQGPLARRILRAFDSDYSLDRFQTVYRTLCECLNEGRMFA